MKDCSHLQCKGRVMIISATQRIPLHGADVQLVCALGLGLRMNRRRLQFLGIVELVLLFDVMVDAVSDAVFLPIALESHGWLGW